MKLSVSRSRFARTTNVRNPNRRDKRGKETAMKKLSVLAAIVMAVAFLIPSTAFADARTDCIAKCRGLSLSAQPLCFSQCPAAGPAPTTTVTPGEKKIFCRKDGKSYLPKDYPGKKVCDPSDVVTKCDGDHEKLTDGKCVCKEKFEYFPSADAEGRKCVPVCDEGQRWNDDKGECRPVDECEDVCALALSKQLEQAKQEILANEKSGPDYFWWLLAILIGVWGHFVTHVVVLVRNRKEEEEDEEPETAPPPKKVKKVSRNTVVATPSAKRKAAKAAPPPLPSPKAEEPEDEEDEDDELPDRE